jgi:hypothetical protein
MKSLQRPEAPEVQPIPEHPSSAIQAVHHKKIKAGA